MRVKAVLFDLGNTLLQYPFQGQWKQYLRERLEYVYSHVCDVATNHHVAPLTFASVTAEMIGGERARLHEGAGGVWRFEDRMREALRELQIVCDETRLRAAIETFYEPIHASTSLYPDTISSLEKLTADGYRLGIISDTPWDTPGYLCRNDMEKWGIAKYFQAIYFSGDGEWRKPHPQVLSTAAGMLGVPLQECVAVGDMLSREIAAANAAGIPSIWIDRSGTQEPWEGARPTVRVESLSEAVEAIERAAS